MELHARRFFWPLAMLIAVAGAALYTNSLDGEMVYDDNEAILMNQDVKPQQPLARV